MQDLKVFSSLKQTQVPPGSQFGPVGSLQYETPRIGCSFRCRKQQIHLYQADQSDSSRATWFMLQRLGPSPLVGLCIHRSNLYVSRCIGYALEYRTYVFEGTRANELNEADDGSTTYSSCEDGERAACCDPVSWS
jgi:hypothetical protein